MDIILRKKAAEQGLTRYFTGVPCVTGHVTERYVSNAVCVECNHIPSVEQRVVLRFPPGVDRTIRDCLLQHVLPRHMDALIAEARSVKAAEVVAVQAAHEPDRLAATLARNAARLRKKLAAKGEIMLVMTAKAGGKAKQDFIDVGWTPEMLVEHGYATWENAREQLSKG